MQIIIDIEEDKIRLKTEIRGKQIEYGYNREGTGIYELVGKHPETFDSFLDDEEIEALALIPLDDLLAEFGYEETMKKLR